MHSNKSEPKDFDFNLLQKCVKEKIGIVLPDHKQDKMLHEVAKRMKTVKLDDFFDYLSLLESSPKEKQFVVNLITNVTTKFFREDYHFDFLEKTIPDLSQKNKKIRIWSAGCASGEEPYSIAMTFFENLENPLSFDIKILATDINTNALQIARSGIYKKNEVEMLGVHKKWFVELDEDKYKIVPKIQSIVRFKEFNLLDPWPISKKFDIIFFRNVSIYMTGQASESVLKKFGAFLYAGGFLFLGATETIGSSFQQYKSLGNNIYLKLRDHQKDLGSKDPGSDEKN